MTLPLWHIDAVTGVGVHPIGVVRVAAIERSAGAGGSDCDLSSALRQAFLNAYSRMFDRIWAVCLRLDEGATSLGGEHSSAGFYRRDRRPA